MKSKFVSLIVAIAVVLAMVAVPAVPGVTGVALASDNVTVSIVPVTTYASTGGDFEFDAVINNPDGMNISMFNIKLSYDDTYFTVNSVTGVDFPEDMGAAVFGSGKIAYDPKTAVGTSTNAVSIVGARINCTALSLEGSSTVDYLYTSGPPPAYTKVIMGTTDYLEGGNMSLMDSGTVIIGSPTLTVDVSPAGMGGVAGFGPFPDGSSQSWWAVIGLDAVDTVLGWTFDHWTGDIDLAPTTDPNQVTMDALFKNVTAVFVEEPCELDVSPNSIDISARVGPNEGSANITVTNTGGGILEWAVGYPPIWSLYDTWSWVNTYIPMVLYNPLIPGGTTNELIMVVTDDTDLHNYKVSAVLAPYPPDNVPGAQRTIVGGAPAVLWNATAWIDKCTLDYAMQEGYLTVWGLGPDPVNVYATVSWVYDGCHGWPYYVGKSWNYTMTQVVSLTPGGAPVMVPDVVPCTAEVVGIDSVVTAAGTFDCYHIVHNSTYAPFNGGLMMETWWSDDQRNFVRTEDMGTFDPPSPPGAIPGAVDVRDLLSDSFAGLDGPACCNTSTCNLSFAPMCCNLAAGESVVVEVTGNMTGLLTGTYNDTFCVIGCCCQGIDYECVNVTCAVLPATTLDDVFRDLPADALDYDAEYPGDTFSVYVNFTATVDEFNSIGMTDFAPPGWLVETDNSWCVPPASFNKSNYNKAEYAWSGPGGGGGWDAGTMFSAKYNVTIPATAVPGSNYWPGCDPLPCPPCSGSPINMFPAWVEYWFGPAGPYETVICEEREKIVTVPGCEVGETRDVVGDVLDTVTVNLYEDDDVWEDQDTSSIVGTIAVYEDCADDTGMYYKVASKYCYYSLNTRPTGDGGTMPLSRNPAYPDYVDWSTPEKLAAGNVLNFVGDYGLICKAASMSYAMEAVNHMLFIPLGDDGITLEPDWQLSGWKVTQVVHSWQFPCGCNC